jgi:hypothetical protein
MAGSCTAAAAACVGVTVCVVELGLQLSLQFVGLLELLWQQLGAALGLLLGLWHGVVVGGVCCCGQGLAEAASCSL